MMAPKMLYRTVTNTINSVKVDKQNGTIAGLFAVGDRLNLDAVPAEEDYIYTSCHYEGFKNPGDTVALVNQELNQHSQMEDWKKITVEWNRTELTPQFTNEGNRIEIKYENGADQYFYLTQLASAKEKNGKFTDKRILKIDDSLTRDNVTPVLGHAYTLNAVPSAGNDGTIHPVFTLADGTRVNGWAVDVIAKYKAAQNVITVGWESYNPSDVRYYSLEGLVRYDTVTVRQSSQGLKNEPAKEVLVTAAGQAVPYYNRNNALGQTVVRQSASTDNNGHFVLDGVKAIAGDRISVLVSDNGVVQAEYRFVPENGAEENRTFTEQRANHASHTNEIVKQTARCMVVDITANSTFTKAEKGDTTLTDEEEGKPDPIRLPVITGYIPYVTDVRFPCWIIRPTGGTTPYPSTPGTM